MPLTAEAPVTVDAALAPVAPVAVAPAAPSPAPRVIYRHRLPVRIAHWINVVCLVVLLGSGLQIFNAHPALYWGDQSTFADPWIKLGARGTPEGMRGETVIGGVRLDTTGVFGASREADGRMHARGFPTWSTIPGFKSLALGRDWHFTFAWIFMLNGALYLAWTFASRHFSRDLKPDRVDLRGIPRSIRDHMLFRHPVGDAAIRYNVLQKLAYLAVILVLGPGIVLMGLAMSPWFSASFDWAVDLVGGRQSARTLHFLIATGFVLFALIHVFEAIITGFWNNLRSMLSGRWKVPQAPLAKVPEEATDGAV